MTDIYAVPHQPLVAYAIAPFVYATRRFVWTNIPTGEYSNIEQKRVKRERCLNDIYMKSVCDVGSVESGSLVTVSLI